jgi:membrane protease YdiL (CAAX protease family)
MEGYFAGYSSSTAFFQKGFLKLVMNAEKTPQYNSWLANHIPPAILVTAVGYLLLGYLEMIKGLPGGGYIPAILYFLSLGVLAFWLMPYVLGLPNGRKTLREFCLDIRLLPVQPVGRNILLGLLMAGLTISAVLVASLLTGRFQLDWSFLPALRWVKGLTRGIWEEVFFRGIVLVLMMRLYPNSKTQGILWAAFLFALIHFRSYAVEDLVDLVSIFFIALLCTYLALKTGSLLPGIIFHYVHDIFILLVQNTPGADRTFQLVLFYAFLWSALLIGGIATKLIVERQPGAAKVQVPGNA